ncbi:cytochrome P450 [Maricurvus nonylphenolicus]|uniref:cytochrome P450 n=1 Tax=Maricurvus nonylphenolicus TaxID=1008307 RepID=UPI0036F337F9
MTKYEEFNILDLSIIADNKGPAVEYFEYLRKNAPVKWNPATESYKSKNDLLTMDKGFWILTKHEDVQAVSRNTKLFSSAEGGPLLWDATEEQLGMHRAGIMGKDAPEHTAVRKVAMPPFLPKNLLAYKPQIEKIAKQIVDGVANKGECELVFDIASRLPVQTFCEILGVPEEDREMIFNLGNQIADTETPYRASPEELTPTLKLFAYCEELSKKKRENPDDSLLSTYVNGEIEGEKVDQFTINMFFVTLSIAGHETTRNTLVHFMRLMKEHPEQYDLIKSDPDKYLPNALHEVLRVSPPVMQFRRTVMEDTEIRGQKIKKGDKVFLSYVSANRDEDLFEDPNKFDITRENARKHLAFGVGPHTCLGAQLALMQLQVLIKEILERIPDLAPTGDIEYLDSIWFHAIMKMPVKFTPEK